MEKLFDLIFFHPDVTCGMQSMGEIIRKDQRQRDGKTLEILNGFNKILGAVTSSAVNQFQTEKKNE